MGVIANGANGVALKKTKCLFCLVPPCVGVIYLDVKLLFFYGTRALGHKKHEKYLVTIGDTKKIKGDKEGLPSRS